MPEPTTDSLPPPTRSYTRAQAARVFLGSSNEYAGEVLFNRFVDRHTGVVFLSNFHRSQYVQNILFHAANDPAYLSVNRRFRSLMESLGSPDERRLSVLQSMTPEQIMWLPLSAFMAHRFHPIETYVRLRLMQKLVSYGGLSSERLLQVLSYLVVNLIVDTTDSGYVRLSLGNSQSARFTARSAWTTSIPDGLSRDEGRKAIFDFFFDYLDKVIDAISAEFLATYDPREHSGMPSNWQSVSLAFLPSGFSQSNFFNLNFLELREDGLFTTGLSPAATALLPNVRPLLLRHNAVSPVSFEAPGTFLFHHAGAGGYTLSQQVRAFFSNIYNARLPHLSVSLDGRRFSLANFASFFALIKDHHKTFIVLQLPEENGGMSFSRSAIGNIAIRPETVRPEFNAFELVIERPEDVGRPANYSYRVEQATPTIITASSLDPLFGVELEVSSDYTYNQLRKSWLVPKSDGSVGGSRRFPMELVTSPMTYSVQRRRWREFFQEHPSTGFCLLTNNNGLHIHVAQRSFINEDHYTNFIRFFLNRENYTFLQILSQRRMFTGGPGSYTGVPRLLEHIVDERQQFDDFHNKYSPLGIKSETVECRLFNGYATLGMMLLALDFMGALFVFSFESKRSLKPISVSDFTNWLSTTQRSQYRTLKRWLEGLPQVVRDEMVSLQKSKIIGGYQFDSLGLMVARPPILLPEPVMEKIKEIKPPKVMASCSLSTAPDGTVFRRNFFSKPAFSPEKRKEMFKVRRSAWPISNQDMTIAS